MVPLVFTCFDEFHVTLDGEHLTNFQTDKVRALLIYLVLEPKVHTRADLAQFLWPGYGADSANNSLRQSLHRLRQLLKESSVEPPWLLSTRQTIQLNPEAAVTSDVATFRNLMAQCVAHDHAALERCSACLARLQQAVDLYRGDFLAGFTVADSDPFEEWRRITQEELHLQALNALTQLGHAAETAGDDEAAHHAAQRQLQLEPWLESAHRRVMRILAGRGQRAAAMAQYQRCRQVLADEFGVEPDAETVALYGQIRSGQAIYMPSTLTISPTAASLGAATSTGESHPRFLTSIPVQRDPIATEQLLPPLPVTAAPLLDLGEMPVTDFFTGRAVEEAELTAWLTLETNSSPVRLISILGLGGMGKTTLAAHVVRKLAPTFSVVIWRSLLNAPPVEELVGWWLQRLARQQLSTIPDSLDGQLRLLIGYLQQERVLLILDNVESLFASPEGPGRAGVMRTGYETYDQLLQRLTTGEHQGTLLITSREQPYVLNRLGRQAQAEGGPLRVLALGGLDQQASQLFLQNNGLAASAEETSLLVRNYSGNPLALQIAAATIADFFGGDVAAFQQEEGGLFDGMRLVLEQQFARLSPLERDLLIWLAIEREPVTVSTLRSNLVQGHTTREVLEALQALQGRSLLENSAGALALQNVIIEYTTEYVIEQIYLEITATQWVSGADNELLNNSFLNRFALLKTQAKEYIQQSQRRLLLQPLRQRLVDMLGYDHLVQRIRDLLDQLRAAAVRTGYAAGNLCNLLIQLGENLSGYDFSHLPVWQVDLRRLLFVAPNFSGADLKNSLFTAGIAIVSVKFRTAGEMLVAGIDNSELCLWRMVNGQLVDAFRSIGNVRKPLVFSDDGAYLAVAGVDQRIQIWSTQEGRCVQLLAGHQGTIFGLVFSPDGTYLASGGGDQFVCLWHLESGRCCQRLAGYEQGVDTLVFSPDSQILATGGGDGQICLWNTACTSEEGELLDRWEGHTKSIGALAFTPDGSLLASGSHNGTVSLWSLTNLAETGSTFVTNITKSLSSQTSIVRFLAFQPLSTASGANAMVTTATAPAYLLAGGSSDQVVRLWEIDARAGGIQLRYTLLGHRHELAVLSFSPDGQQLASCGFDQQIYLWDVHSGQAISSLQAYHYGLSSVAISRDGRRIITGGSDRIVHVWQSDADEPAQAQPHLSLRGHEHFLRDVAFSPSGRVIASSGAERIIRLWDSATGQSLPTLTGHAGAVLALAFAPQQVDGGAPAMLASAGADRTIRFWSIPEMGQGMPHFQRQLSGHEDEILALAFTPNGKELITGCMNGSVRIWDIEHGITRHQLLGHTTAVTCVSITPDGGTLATISFDYTIRLWDVASGRCRHIEREGVVGAMAVAFGYLPGSDESILAYGGDDFAIYLWPWQTGNKAIALRGHNGPVTRIAFHPTAPFLISCSHDNSVRLWDLTTMACSQVLQPLGPYTGMRIGGIRGISDAQKAVLVALGAVTA